jgi:CheY-like chemotaxis protein
VRGNAGELLQALVNLVLNARDASPAGAAVRIGAARAGEFAVIDVDDDGPGVPPALAERIFEPFFTTKGVGEGTGLGLAVAYGIVRSHKGWINVYSEPGQGAVFRIYLPATEKEVATRERAAQAISGGRETILVVDDEPVVLKLACDILASYGYRTLTAQDGEEAIQVFQNQMADIDLVLLDLTMPKLNGLEAARRLRALNPAIRVIASSGYSAQTRDILNGEVQAFVPKPYGPKDLAGTVRAVLDGSENSRFAKKSGLPVEKVIY